MKKTAAVALGIGAGFAVIVSAALGTVAVRWASGYLLVGAVESGILLRNLDRNRNSSGSPYATFGLANWLTLLRGFLVAVMFGFVLVDRIDTLGVDPRFAQWIPALLYTMVIVLDYVDGAAARSTGHVSQLGQILDNEVDSLGILTAALALAFAGRVPVWFVLVGLARYLFVGGAALRRRLGKKQLPLRHSISGKVIAGLMMGYLSGALWPIVPAHYARMASLLFFVPFAGSFLRDWLLAVGAIRPDTRWWGRARDLFVAVAFRYLPLALRAATVLFFALTWPLFPTGLNAAAAVLAAATAAGLFGRLSALGLVAIVVLGVPGHLPIQSILVMACLAVVVCGTGRLSLWEPERRLFGSSD